MNNRSGMLNQFSRRWRIFLSFAGLAGFAGAAESGIHVELEETWACIFAGKPAVFHVVIASDNPFEGRLMWGLTAGDGVVARGEQEVLTTGSTRHEIQLDIPDVRTGVTAVLTLAVSVASSDGVDQPVSLKRTLYAFHENPFADQHRWLESRKIHLFDPEDHTRTIFDDFAIPYTAIFQLDEIASLKNTLLVIGEGISPADYPALMELIAIAAEKGNSVLCLSPRDSEMILPGTPDSALKMPTRIAFSREEIIRKLDKRLDAASWTPGGNIFNRSMTTRSSRGTVVKEFADGSEGWPWFEAWFADTSGHLIITTLPLIERWSDGPVPRYLLMKMFEYVSK